MAAAGAEFREVSFEAQPSQMLQTMTEMDVHFPPQVIPSSTWEPKVPQRDPPASQGSRMGAKVTPRTALGSPRCPQGTHQHCKGAKGRSKSPQGEQKDFQRHPKETNKSQNYIHLNKIYANSRSTAIQRPASILRLLRFHLHASVSIAARATHPPSVMPHP